MKAHKERGDMDPASFVPYKPTKEENQPIVNPKRYYSAGLKSFLRQYAPDFCWCSVHDLLIMVEQVPLYEDVAYDTFAVTVHQLKKEGLFITKKTIHYPRNQSRGSIGKLYLRVSNAEGS